MNKEIRAEVREIITTLESSSPDVAKHIIRIKPLLEAEFKLFLSALPNSIDPDRDPNWRKGRKSAAKNAERAVSSFTAALSALYEEDALGAAAALKSLSTSSVVFKAPPVQETASVSRSMEDMIHDVNYMWSIEWYLKGELKSLLEESDVEGNYKRWKEYEHTQTMRVAAARNSKEASVISENLFNMHKSVGKDAIELLIKARDIYHKLLRYESRRLSGERPTQEDG